MEGENGNCLVLFNPTQAARFEYITTTLEKEECSGNVLVPGLGFTFVNKTLLGYSDGGHDIKMKEEADHYFIDTVHYSLKVAKTGQIQSLIDKTTKNEPREVARQPLNQLAVHNDVPFFWDAWDIFHHSFETKMDCAAKDSKVLLNNGKILKI